MVLVICIKHAIYVFIYIDTQAEREVSTCIYLYLYVSVYIYIYQMTLSTQTPGVIKDINGRMCFSHRRIMRICYFRRSKVCFREVFQLHRKLLRKSATTSKQGDGTGMRALTSSPPQVMAEPTVCPLDSTKEKLY